MSRSFLIVGLGNPGDEYNNTRHNVGFHVVDELAYKLDANFSFQKSCKAMVTKVRLKNDISYILAKPTTYMNLSGESVYHLLSWYDISATNCIVITDNVDLEVSKVRVKKKGSGGTHNGIRSLHAHLKSMESGLDYIRIYIGIGSHRTNQKLSKYVLDKWHESEDSTYQQVFRNIADSLIELPEQKKFDEFLNKNNNAILHELLATSIIQKINEHNL